MTKKYKLREPILFQNQIIQENEFGTEIIRWKYAFSSWATICSLFNNRQIGHEVAFAKEVVSANYYQFTVRYRPCYNTKMRIIWSERKFDVTKVIDTDKRKKLTYIVAKEAI